MYFWLWLGDYCHGWYKRDVFVKSRHCKWWNFPISKVIIKRVRFDGATLSGLFIFLKAPGIAYDRDPPLACKSSPGLL